MATKRMVSLKIVDSDAFLDMPQTSQLLYFHLCLRTDDDGFVGNPKKIMRMVGSAENDLTLLFAKKFIIGFESGVIVIKHHRINNNWDKHNCKRTQYLDEFNKLELKENSSYKLKSEEAVGFPTETRLKPDLRIEENRIDKKRIDKNINTLVTNVTSEQSSQIQEIMNLFYEINPSLQFGNKTIRKGAEQLIKKYGFEGAFQMAKQVISVQGKPFAPVAVNPNQMWLKLAQFKIYFSASKETKKIIEIPE